MYCLLAFRLKEFGPIRSGDIYLQEGEISASFMSNVLYCIRCIHEQTETMARLTRMKLQMYTIKESFQRGEPAWLLMLGRLHVSKPRVYY